MIKELFEQLNKSIEKIENILLRTDLAELITLLAEYEENCDDYRYEIDSYMEEQLTNRDEKLRFLQYAYAGKSLNFISLCIENEYKSLRTPYYSLANCIEHLKARMVILSIQQPKLHKEVSGLITHVEHAIKLEIAEKLNLIIKNSFAKIKGNNNLPINNNNNNNAPLDIDVQNKQPSPNTGKRDTSYRDISPNRHFKIPKIEASTSTKEMDEPDGRNAKSPKR